jgi:deoxyribonuclease IV
MFGSHLSIAGSMLNALHQAMELGLDSVQVFTKNQQQWKAKPLDPGVVKDWRAEVSRLGWDRGCRDAKGGLSRGRVVSHASYLANLAGPDDGLWRRSVDLMTDEIERCEALGISLLVHHPGSYTTSDASAGLGRIVQAYRELLARTRGSHVVCCLENTVGSGGNMGRDFEELGRIRREIVAETGEPDRVAFCLDTCHAHAGGYDLSTAAQAEAALRAFDHGCGLESVMVVHMNDSKGAMGSRRDLHEHIGQGTIGKHPEGLAASGFSAVVNHKALANIPKIMETPKGENDAGTPWDALNLRRLRGLMSLEPAPEKAKKGERRSSDAPIIETAPARRRQGTRRSVPREP